MMPVITQNVRVYGGPLASSSSSSSAGPYTSSLYAGFIQQYAGSLILRDREPCYIWEPNGGILQPGIAEGRLVGSYLGLPLFTVTCIACS